MRRFSDAWGREWDVVVGRESWGTLYALFVPVAGTEPVRQVMLDSAGYEQAQLELSDMDDAALAELFRRTGPKQS